MSDYGMITGPGEVRFERLLPGPVERVWSYLVDSEKRARWLASGPMDLSVGGRVELAFDNAGLSAVREPTPERFQASDCSTCTGRVTAIEPARLLRLTWGGTDESASEVSFELGAEGGATRLVVTHRRLADKGMMVNVSSGWHTHLAILEDVLADRPARPFWSNFLTLEQAYLAGGWRQATPFAA